MRFFIVQFAILATLVGEGIAAPSPLLPVQRSNGATTGKYIIKFKSGASRKAWATRKGVSHAVDWPHTNGLAG